jgi:hypothetical protein
MNTTSRSLLPCLALLALASCSPAADIKVGGPPAADSGSGGGDDTAAATGDSGGGDTEPVDTATTGDPAVSFPLGSIGGFSYTLDFTLGGQTFGLIVDSGSSSAGVAGSGCSNCSVNPAYEPSSTATDKNRTADSTYADGSGWSGEIYQDTATMTGLPDVALDFVNIESQSDFFQRGADYQGILGLGPAALLLRGTSSYMDSLSDEGVREMMAFRLCPDDGEMWIGGYDGSAATAPVQYSPIETYNGDAYYYAVEMDDMAVGGESLGLSSRSFGMVLIDTGTSLTYVPQAVLDDVVDAVNADPGFQSMFSDELSTSSSYSCVTTTASADEIDAALPKLTLEFPAADGSTFPVELPATRSYLVDYGSQRGSEYYCLAIYSSGSNNQYSLIGDSMLTGMLTVFDADNGQIGFAPATSCDSGRHARQRVQPDFAGAPDLRNAPGFRAPPLWTGMAR